MERKINRFTKLFPWYAGFTGDLLFYIAIDTLFLTIVKDLSPAQIVSINSFSQFACVVLQLPLLYIMKRIGNTASVRTGSFFLLLSAVTLTLGRNYYVILLGRTFHDIAVILRSAFVVMLENNLDIVDRRSDFVRVRTAGNTVYAVITMLISFVASYLFNLNHYLPMIGCITTCAIGFALSLLMKDHSDYDKVTVAKKDTKVKLHYSKFIVLAIVVYAIFYPVVSAGQSEGKLFIQQHVLLSFDVEQTALIIGAILCASRIIRVFSNVVFAKLYEKHQAKMGVILPALLCASLAFMLFGSLIPQAFIKLIVMGFGYVIVLFARDPFRLYMQDVMFENTPKEQHQTLVVLLQFGVKVGTAAIGLVFSAILLRYPMVVVMAILFALAAIEIALAVKLYQMILTARKQKTQAC